MAIFLTPKAPQDSDFRLSGLYLIIGQSNAVGEALISSADVTLQGAISGARVWNNGASAFQGLVAGTNNLGATASKFGPEMKFAYDMTQAGGEVDIIKYAVGATNLKTNWAPRTGTQYITALQWIDAAMTAYRTAHGIHAIKGILWIQGEGDSNSIADSTAYKARLSAFIDAIRSDLSTRGYCTNQVRFIICRIGTTSLADDPYADTVRSAQADVAAEKRTENVGYLDTTGFTLDAGNVHFDAGGQTSIGAEFADNFI